MRDGRMHQTTIRFSPDLWESLEAECAALGVSAAQYVREAALARLAFSAARRGEREYEMALAAVGAAFDYPAPQPAAVPVETPGPRSGDATRARLDVVGAEVIESALEANAVAAQNDLVRQRSERLRAEAARLRRLSEERHGRAIPAASEESNAS